MFESLTGKRREGGMAQPIMSFAVHASIIAFAVGAGNGRMSVAIDPEPVRDVIYIPATPGTTPKVEGQPEPVQPGPSPVCHCEVPVPGPLVVDDYRGGLPKVPGIPTPTLPGVPGRFLRDSTQRGTLGVYTEGDLTDSPVLVHFPQPVYPPALRTAGFDGQVKAAYVVDPSGHVEPGSIVIVSSDHSLLSESVRVSLLAAQFRPGMVRGLAVRTRVQQTIRFSLMSL